MSLQASRGFVNFHKSSTNSPSAFGGHLITNFPKVMPLLRIKSKELAQGSSPLLVSSPLKLEYGRYQNFSHDQRLWQLCKLK